MELNLSVNASRTGFPSSNLSVCFADSSPGRGASGEEEKLSEMPKPPLGRSNNDDRRQWRKQGVAVGAAASKTQAKRCGCWVPQPGQWHGVSRDGEVIPQQNILRREPMGLFGFGKKEKDKMKDGLEKTRTGFWGNILNTLTGSKIDDDLYDELEEQLILADVGGDVAMKLVDALRDRVQEKGLKTGEQAADALRDIIADEMRPEAEMALDGHPAVILVIGVNGVGKTTSIAKLADYYTRQGKKVMLAAGDTFRAAASEQLEIWAGRAGVPIVKAGEGADPAAVIFDTVKSATARGYDMVIADTAGRLHNKSNLMSELSKISRSVKKAAPEASLETLLVLDAITGQNAISQAKEFCKAADATGIILTKLDGTAKGGCVVAVKQRLGLPVRFIGVGEGIDDLIPFTPEGFVEELIPRTGWKH